MTRLRSNIARPARLTAEVTAGATTLPVSTTDGWPAPTGGNEALGCLSYPDIDRIELFTYTGKTDDSFTGVVRGVDDTSPRAHHVRALVVHVASADELGAAGATTLDELDDVDSAGAVAGDHLVFDGTGWFPTPEKYVQFVYNSADTQGGNRYNDWSDLMAVLDALAGPKLILFEQDETIPAGAWNLDNVTLRGNRLEYTVGGVTLTFGNNTTISSWVNPKINSIRLLSTSTTGPIWSPSGAATFYIEQVSHVHSTTEPFIEHSGGGQFVISLNLSSRWKLLSGGVENLHDTSAAFATTLVIARGAGTEIDNDTLSSDNDVIFIDVVADTANDLDAWPWPGTHTNLVVGFQLGVMQTRAVATFFDATGLSIITAENVQDGLEELDAAVAAVPTITSGTYTPTATASTLNCDAVTPGLAFYTQIDDIVTVSGFVAVDHTTAGAATVVTMTLPVASDLASFDDLAGTCACEDAAGSVRGEETGNKARLDFTAPSTATRFYGYNYSYRVL